MTDEELVKALRDFAESPYADLAADRIEALTAKVKLMDDLDVINGEKIEALTEQLKTVLDREAATTARYDAKLETLTEQLEAARSDAKEAEAYAEELEKEIELNEQEACMVEDDLIKADKEIDDLKAKLAKAMSIAKRVTSFEDTTEELLECGCARCKAHLDLRAALAEIEGEKT
jgi:hypothetical protein